MRTLYFSIAVIIVATSFTHFKSENKELTKDYVYVPAGSVNGAAVNGFYISKAEITNVQYRQFIHYLEANRQYAKLRDAAVDTAQWRNFFAKNEQYAGMYFQNAHFDNYPVVTISYEGAQLYCEWLTGQYNANAKTKVEFRLPTENEWMLAAEGGDTGAVYPWKGASLTCTAGKWKGEDMCNYKHGSAMALTLVKSTGEVMITAPSLSYLPNKYGIYNMSGNVAELIQERGFTKGGGWASNADKVTIAARETYNKNTLPSPNIGFRPVMVVKE